MAVHTGHRGRLKQKFLSDSFTHFADHEILEALLFYIRPYRDTNPLAHALIDTGGSLSGALALDAAHLREIPECPVTAPLFFSLIREIGRRAHGEETVAPTYGNDTALRDLAKRLTADVTDDRTVLLLFDNHYRLLGSPEVYRGYYASSAFRTQDVVAPALRARASVAVLVSTHASRIARPDPYEIAATRHMASALRLAGVTLTDHLILAGSQCYSVAAGNGPLLASEAPAAKLSEGDKCHE